MSAKRKQQWGALPLEVEERSGGVSWQYADGGGGGCVRIDVTKDGWAFVVTDDEEGSAMFPDVLIPAVCRLLRASRSPGGQT